MPEGKSAVSLPGGRFFFSSPKIQLESVQNVLEQNREKGHET